MRRYTEANVTGFGTYVLTAGRPDEAAAAAAAPAAGVYEGMNGSAVVAAEEGEGAWGVPGPVRRRRLTQDFDPTRRYRVRWQVHVIYSTHPQGGNVLTASHLNQARALESALEGAGGYPRFCWQGLDDEAGGVLRTITRPTLNLLPPPARVCMIIDPEGESCSDLGPSACAE